MNILCATDDNYAPYCGIMLTSVFENNRQCPIHVYVIVDIEVQGEGKLRKLEKLAAKYHQQLDFICVDNETLKKYGARPFEYISLAAYYRLLAADLLPDTVKTILYLDCDLIVKGSLMSLYQIDLSNYAVGMVVDCLCFKESKYETLGYAKEKGYCNSGVSLFNLEYWRKNNAVQSCMEFLNLNSFDLECPDQDALNAVFVNERYFLPIEYNFQYLFLCKTNYPFLSKDIQEQIDVAVQSPVIVHYCGSLKPWQLRFRGLPFSNLWIKYQMKSFWKCHFDFRPYNKILKHTIKRVLWAMHIYREQMGIMPKFYSLK